MSTDVTNTYSGYAYITVEEGMYRRDPAELEALRKFKEGVPWKDIQTVLWHMPNGVPFAPYKRLDQWSAKYAPQESAE